MRSGSGDASLRLETVAVHPYLARDCGHCAGAPWRGPLPGNAFPVNRSRHRAVRRRPDCDARLSI